MYVCTYRWTDGRTDGCMFGQMDTICISMCVYMFTTELGIAGSHQYENASLACQVCRQWLIEMQHSSFEIESVKLSETRPHKLLAVEPQIDHHGLGLKNGDTNNDLVITNGVTNEIESDNGQSVIKKSNHESHDKRHVCGIPVAEPFNLPPLFLQGENKLYFNYQSL